MNLPLVTVLMPVYNGEEFLNDAIISILGQSFEEFEFLIINDGSTDSTEKIILSYKDNRIRYVKNETNLKLIETLNKGIVLSQGKYVVRMDADDISAVDRIEKQVAFMEKNPEVGLCGSWFTRFEGDDERICKYVEQHDEILFKMFYQCHFCHPSLIIRKKILEGMVSPFNEDYIHAEDYELYYQLSKKCKFHNIQDTLLKYRIHNLSISIQNECVQYENALKIKKMFFSNIDTNVTNEELVAFDALNYQNYNAIQINRDRIKMLLESMIYGNRKENFINKQYFEKEIKTLWLNYNYHKGSLQSYRSSKLLFDKNLVKTVTQLKWRIISLFKK